MYNPIIKCYFGLDNQKLSLNWAPKWYLTLTNHLRLPFDPKIPKNILKIGQNLVKLYFSSYWQHSIFFKVICGWGILTEQPICIIFDIEATFALKYPKLESSNPLKMGQNLVNFVFLYTESDKSIYGNLWTRHSYSVTKLHHFWYLSQFSPKKPFGASNSLSIGKFNKNLVILCWVHYSKTL